MFCPRCGAQAAENTRFCRGCGLPLAAVGNFVASGGAEAPAPPVNSTGSMAGTPSGGLLAGMTPKQRMVMTILFFIFAPAVMGIIGDSIGLDELAALPSVLIPIGIVWAVFRYKNEMRRLTQSPLTNQPTNLPGQTYQPPLPPHQTNPLHAVPQRGSVVEDETQRFRNQ